MSSSKDSCQTISIFTSTSGHAPVTGQETQKSPVEIHRFGNKPGQFSFKQHHLAKKTAQAIR